MTEGQGGILASVPLHARYLEFKMLREADVKTVLLKLSEEKWGETVVFGLGFDLISKLGSKIEGLKVFADKEGVDCRAPGTQNDLWCWIRGEDRGDILHTARKIGALVANAFELASSVDGFRFKEGLDLTGYEDGTENPQGEDAVAAAFSEGASFVAVQQWVHDLDHFKKLPQLECDHIIGRRLSDNEELDDAPISAHVKRTAQESFDPEAFVLRRSMPWCDAQDAGLMFVAFGCNLDAFDAQLNRMLGLEDGVADALFCFSKPVSGSYFWCPPIKDGYLDFSAL